jgi:hypothetical protein
MKNVLIIIFSCLLVACSSTNRNVIFVAETGLGAKVATNPKNQLYEATIGFLDNYISIVPVQLNTQNPDNEDASKSVSIMSSLDLFIDWSKIEMHNKYIITSDDAQIDDEAVKHLMESQSVRFSNGD